MIPRFAAKMVAAVKNHHSYENQHDFLHDIRNVLRQQVHRIVHAHIALAVPFRVRHRHVNRQQVAELVP